LSILINIMNNHITFQADNTDYNIHFFMGVFCLWQAKYKHARHFFLNAVTDTYPLDTRHDLYLSYLGLSAVLMDHKSGILNHSYHSSNNSLSEEPDVQLNLACAEFLKGNRKSAIEAMDKIELIEFSENADEIHAFFDIVGKREINAQGKPKRDNFMGKIFRKRKTDNDNAEQIEAFIIDTAKKRYKDVMIRYLH